MISFPSTLNRGGSKINIPQNTNSLKDVLNNSLKSAFNAAISNATSGQGYDTDGIRYDEDRDTKSLLDKFDFTANDTIKYESNLLSKYGPNMKDPYPIYTPMNMSEGLFSIINNYRGVINNVTIESGIENEVPGSNGEKIQAHNFVGAVAPSLFNPYNGLLVQGITDNVPLLDGTKEVDVDYANLEDCSINELVRLSSQKISILGQARYKYSDFMYCKDLGKISNNHMITLRKFTTPIGDDIFSNGPKDTGNPNMGDVGRMITWFDTDDNKLSDIMSYEYKATWKELNSKISQKESQEEDDARGSIGKIVNTLSVSYNDKTAAGIADGGALKWLLEKMHFNLKEPTYRADDIALGRNTDANKVYEPKDTIQDTHIYEGKLVFNQEFNLNFSYKLRAYDNINPKSAFLDLIGNILTVTYRKGNFWGGRNEILGVKPNKEGWNKYKKIMDTMKKSGGDALLNMLGGESNVSDSIMGFVGDMGNIIGSTMGISVDNVMKKIGELRDNPKETIKEGIKKLSKSEHVRAVGRATFGLVENKLGRPALYVFDSLLTGSNVGLWHVTIGNPKNPIAAFGNLIMTGCKITHSGPLGLDDFPTDLTVTVSLKHAKSRDATDISKMYTKGRNAIYLSLCSPLTNIQFRDEQKIYNAQTSIEQNKLQSVGKDGERIKDSIKVLSGEQLMNNEYKQPTEPEKIKQGMYSWTSCDIQKFIANKDQER